MAGPMHGLVMPAPHRGGGVPTCAPPPPPARAPNDESDGYERSAAATARPASVRPPPPSRARKAASTFAMRRAWLRKSARAACWRLWPAPTSASPSLAIAGSATLASACRSAWAGRGGSEQRAEGPATQTRTPKGPPHIPANATTYLARLLRPARVLREARRQGRCPPLARRPAAGPPALTEWSQGSPRGRVSPIQPRGASAR